MSSQLKKWDSAEIVTFQEQFLFWYYQHKRTLPWRGTNNPYYIWISEIMLQQTRVDTVIGYYYRFIDKYPTIQALAEAEEESLLSLGGARLLFTCPKFKSGCAANCCRIRWPLS